MWFTAAPPYDEGMQWVDCTDERHGEAILAIFNEAIVHSTALYDYEPRTRAQMTSWFEAKRAGGFPVIGLESEAGELMGFASYGSFRAWPAYKYTIEHSLYVHRDRRRGGVGRALLSAVVDHATGRGYRTIIGGIDADNAASIALHVAQGFAHAGTIHDAGYKFGRWLDLAFYQKMLPGPARPSEGQE